MYASDYTIQNYDIKVIVKEDNTLKIIEKIGAYFNVEKDGIYRIIPPASIKIKNGTVTGLAAEISNISASEKYKLKTENGFHTIQIGSSAYGAENYELSYTIDLGKDKNNTYDELEYDLIDYKWDTTISNVTFQIMMPKEFDESKLSFTNTDLNVTYSVTGRMIIGRVDGTLNEGEKLTLRLELPNEYFKYSPIKLTGAKLLACIIPIIFACIGYYVWKKYGQDEQTVETVRFYPPEGLNSLEVAYAYNGQASSKDVTSLLIYLANKGYIKIEEIQEPSKFSKSEMVKLIKVKEYDGNNEFERIFMEELFKKRAFVILRHLERRFYKTVNKILRNSNGKDNKHKFFEEVISGKTRIMVLMIFIIYCVITIPPVAKYAEVKNYILAIVFPAMGMLLTPHMLLGNIKTVNINTGKEDKTAIRTKLLGIVWGLMFGVVPWFFMVWPSLLEDKTYLLIYIIGVICVCIVAICIFYLPKRTKYGIEIVGQITGFKNYLETVGIESIAMENPAYFYDILPYAYVLGLSDKWIQKFEVIEVEKPNWYESKERFDGAKFISKTMESIQKSMAIMPDTRN